MSWPFDEEKIRPADAYAEEQLFHDPDAQRRAFEYYQLKNDMARQGLDLDAMLAQENMQQQRRGPSQIHSSQAIPSSSQPSAGPSRRRMRSPVRSSVRSLVPIPYSIPPSESAAQQNEMYAQYRPSASPSRSRSPSPSSPSPTRPRILPPQNYLMSGPSMSPISMPAQITTSSTQSSPGVTLNVVPGTMTILLSENPLTQTRKIVEVRAIVSKAIAEGRIGNISEFLAYIFLASSERRKTVLNALNEGYRFD